MFDECHVSLCGHMLVSETGFLVRQLFHFLCLCSGNRQYIYLFMLQNGWRVTSTCNLLKCLWQERSLQYIHNIDINQYKFTLMLLFLEVVMSINVHFNSQMMNCSVKISIHCTYWYLYSSCVRAVLSACNWSSIFCSWLLNSLVTFGSVVWRNKVLLKHGALLQETLIKQYIAYLDIISKSKTLF